MTRATADLAMLLLGLGAFMIVATVIGQILQNRYSPMARTQ